ncbi:MAG: hypothetical protein PHS82_16975 [Lachnospiraceae bacterium]|nr:hypothetical protein [Lachnospiraceae bacterium]
MLPKSKEAFEQVKVLRKGKRAGWVRNASAVQVLPKKGVLNLNFAEKRFIFDRKQVKYSLLPNEFT